MMKGSLDVPLPEDTHWQPADAPTVVKSLLDVIDMGEWFPPVRLSAYPRAKKPMLSVRKREVTNASFDRVFCFEK